MKDHQKKQGTGEPSAAKKWLHEKSSMGRLLNLSKDENINEILDHIKNYMFETRGKITTSQVRNIFSKVKNTRDYKRLQLIRPHLAYIAARQNNPIAREVVEFLERVVSQVSNDDQLAEFTMFFEAVVAYHKYYNTEKN